MASKKQRDRDFARLIGGLLNEHGYGLTNLDSNDKAMQAALRDFQASRGLRETGTATPETHKALKLPPVAVDILNDQPAEEGMPMPQLRPEPIAVSGEASANLGAAGEAAPVSVTNPLAGANSPLAGVESYEPVDNRGTSVPDFNEAMFSAPPRAAEPTPANPAAAGVRALWSPETTAFIAGEERAAEERDTAERLALDRLLQERAGAEWARRAYLPSYVKGASDEPPPMSPEEVDRAHGYVPDEPSQVDPMGGPRFDDWYERRFNAIEDDRALDKMAQPAFDEAANASPIVAANGSLIGDIWRTVRLVADWARRGAAEGKIGFPGGKAYGSAGEMAKDYAQSGLGALGAAARYIGESIITPAEGSEMTDAEALEFLIGKEPPKARDRSEER